MNITEFKNKIGGFSYTNNYLIQIIPPVALDNFFPEVNGLIKLTAQETNLDFGKINSIEHTQFGKKHTIATNWNYDPVNISFLIERNLIILDFFMAWKQLIVNPYNNDIGYYDDYVSRNFTIALTQSDSNESQKRGFSLINAYPTDLSALKLDYSDIEILKLDITFVYSNMKIIDYSGSAYDSRLFEGVGRTASIMSSGIPGVNESLQRIMNRTY